MGLISVLKSTSFSGPKKKNPMRVSPIKTEKSNARRLVNIFSKWNDENYPISK
jgi:hypothetical protein